MATSSRILFIYFLSLVISIGVFAQAPDVGKILIGTQGNRSDPTEYVFNRNFNNAQGIIPFSAVVISGVDGSEVTKDDQVRVTCVSDTNGQSGYTQVSFNTVDLLVANTEGFITFTVTGEGRPAVVRCFAVSVGLQCPATADQTVPQPEFCQDTSLSDPVTITLSPAPVVSVCQQVIQVPGFTSNTYTGSFQVALSEAVRSFNVTVRCTVADPPSLPECQRPGVSCCQQRNTGLTPSPATVTEGQTSTRITYTVTRPSNGQVCVGVTCSAESSLQLPEGYLQYLTATSSDSSSVGLLQTVVPVLYMQPQYLTVYNTSFQSLLYLDAGVDVPFQCQAAVVTSLEEALQRTLPANIDCSFTLPGASTTSPVVTTPTTTTTTTAPPTTTDVNATIGSTTPPTPAPTPPVDPSSPWTAIDNSFTVTADTRFHVVRTGRELVVIAAVQEVVVTTCCSTVTDTTSIYRGLKVATASVAQLTPRMNNTGGVTSGVAGEERFVVNPAYREVAPCPCDLTFQACDLNCCCDTECTDADKEAFSGCIPGRLGGLSPDPDLRSCKSNHFPKDDWFRVLCVEFESNALLGEFYPNTNKLTSTTDVDNTLAATKKNRVYTYRETEPRFPDLAVTSGYTEGSTVLAITAQGGGASLPLPQPASSGRCLDSAPVRFLRDSQSTCTRTLTPQTCGDLTPFSARVYLQPSALSTPACPKALAVSSTGRSLQDETQRVGVKVNYLCASDSAAYVKAGSPPPVIGPTTVSRFTSNLDSVNCSDLCDADSACLNYNQGREDSATPTPSPPRCSGDNGFGPISVPTYDAATRTCRNVVLSVGYRFTWAGQVITGLTADVVVGEVALGTNDGSAGVSQRFSATFTHDYAGPPNQTDNYQNLATPYQRSGRPGYDYGKPAATGCRVTNTTTGSNLPVDQNPIKQMAVWSPGTDGLCQNARRRLLTFGDDLQSSCVLRLAYNDINTCDSLRTLVWNHLNVLMPANVIGRFGYNSPEIDDMWVEILRENPFPTTTTTTTTPASVVTTTAAATTTTSNVTVAATTTTTTTVAPENVTFDPLSVRGGVCRNVVSGIHLEVLFAETASNNRYPLREIVGAAVRYTVSNWTMSCVGPNAVRCDPGSGITQPFVLSSSVQYTHVTPTRPHKPALFYQIHDKETCDSDTCYRFFYDFDTSICHYDTCWHELFYPITRGYQGSEGVNYTRGFSLLCVLFVLGYVAVTKPWS